MLLANAAQLVRSICIRQQFQRSLALPRGIFLLFSDFKMMAGGKQRWPERTEGRDWYQAITFKTAKHFLLHRYRWDLKKILLFVYSAAGVKVVYG